MAPGAHSGISFHKGQKKLKLDKHIIDDTINFPDDVDFSLKQQKKFQKEFTDDVTRFGERVSESTQKIYDAATAKISTWILDESDPEGELKITSVFTPDEAYGNLRTALVQCNFTDISRLIEDLKRNIKQAKEYDENRVIREIVVDESDAIHSVIDRITATKSGLCVVIFRQFESLRPKFLESLISLIYSSLSTRPIIPRLCFVICVSTSPAFFNQTLSIDSLNLLNLKQFQFTKLDEIFEKVISTGIHSCFRPPRPKATRIEDDDPKLLNSYDLAPAVFSGPFTKYLHNRFFGCDYSVNALIRAVQFALLWKYLEDPLWREETHDEKLKKYDAVMKVFLNEFWEKDAVSLHIEVQSDSQFWEKMKETTTFKERKQFLFDSNSKRNLVDFASRVRSDVVGIDEEWCLKLDDLLEELENARPVEAVATPTRTPGKMSSMELQKQQKMAMLAKQNNPIRAAKSAIYGHLMSLFESTLQPYPSKWRNVIGGHVWEDELVKTSLDSSDEHDIEKCLLVDEQNASRPISIAWRTLLCHRNFKCVPITDWAQEFLSHVKMNKKQAKGAFFAAIGQLEHIGLIRGAADRKSTNVNVLYHPITVIPSI